MFCCLTFETNLNNLVQIRSDQIILIIWFKSDRIKWIKFDLTYSNVQACFLPCLSTKINPHFKILFLIGRNLNMDWFIRTYVHGKKWPLNRFVFTKKCLKPERPKRLSLPFRMRLNIFNLEINEQSCSIQSLVFNHSLTLIIFGSHTFVNTGN